MSFIFSQIPSHLFGLPLLSLQREMGAERFRALLSYGVKEPQVQRYLDGLGPYLLDDMLAHELKLKGVELGPEGEFRALSSNIWEPLPATDVVWSEVEGLLLKEEQSREFLHFLKPNLKNLSCQEICKIARHYFFEESVVLVTNTRPRVSL